MNESERRRTFDAWMADHTGLIFKVVRTFATSFHDQNDLFQQITLQLWESIPNYSGRAAITTWIYRVAFYAAMGWTRTERNRQRPELLGDADRVLVQNTEQRDPRIEQLYDMISQLREVDRSLALMLLDGLSYREMADVLGMTTNHVGVRVNRIKNQLTESLSKDQQI